MAQSQILGLFATPSQVRSAEQERIAQASQRFQDPIAQQMYQSGAQLTGAVGSLFGVQSSAMNKAKATQDLMQNIASPVGTSQYYRDLAEQFRQRGMLQSAIAAANKAQAVDDEAQERAATKYGTISFGQYGSQVPNIRRLITQIERTTDPAAKQALELELQEAFKKGAAEAAKREADEAGAIEQAKFTEQRRNESKKAVQKQFEQANQQDQTVFNIRKRIVDNLDNINTGIGAEAITGFQALARQVGLTEADGRWEELSSNTQAAQAIIGQQMLEQIKTLGTNPSNADREFLMKTLPAVTNEPGAIRKIADFLEAKAIFLREDARAKLKHLESNPDLVNYETPKEIFDKLERFYEEANVTSSRAPLPDVPKIERPQVLENVPAPAEPAPPVAEAEPAPTTTAVEPVPSVTPEVAEETQAETTTPVPTEQMSQAVDAVVKSTFATQFGADLRLSNLRPMERLQIAQNRLLLKLNTQGNLTTAEQKLLSYIEDQIIKTMGPNQ